MAMPAHESLRTVKLIGCGLVTGHCFFWFDGQGRPGQPTHISTNLLSGLVKCRPCMPGLRVSKEIIFLRPDLKNQTLVNCTGNKPTNQPDDFYY